MANFSFALRLALGFLPKTEKIEEERNQLIAEFNKLNEYKESDELKRFNELNEFVESADFKKKKTEITSLNYASSDYCAKEKKFNSLAKDKRVKNYFSVSQSADLKRFDVMSCPWKRIMPAWEKGFFAITHASLIRNFAGKLSVPSMMKS